MPSSRRRRRRAPEAMAVAFARVLRGAGLAVPVSSVVSFAEALGGRSGSTAATTSTGPARATLVRRPEDHELFDRAFRVFWEHAARRRRRGRSRSR